MEKRTKLKEKEAAFERQLQSEISQSLGKLLVSDETPLQDERTAPIGEPVRRSSMSYKSKKANSLLQQSDLQLVKGRDKKSNSFYKTMEDTRRESLNLLSPADLQFILKQQNGKGGRRMTDEGELWDHIMSKVVDSDPLPADPVEAWKKLTEDEESRIGAWTQAISKGAVKVIVPQDWNISAEATLTPLSDIGGSQRKASTVSQVLEMTSGPGTNGVAPKIDKLKSILRNKRVDQANPMKEVPEVTNVLAKLEDRSACSPLLAQLNKVSYNLPLEGEVNSVFFAPDVDSYSAWDMESDPTHATSSIDLVKDEDLASGVLKIMGHNHERVYIATVPKPRLGVRLPFLTMIVKNLGLHWSFEVEVEDSQNRSYHIQFANFKSVVKVWGNHCSAPMRLVPGWNRLAMCLPIYLRAAFDVEYMKTVRIQVNANVYLRRIYFSAKKFHQRVLPVEFKLFVRKRPKVEAELDTRSDESISSELHPASSEDTVHFIDPDDIAAFTVRDFKDWLHDALDEKPNSQNRRRRYRSKSLGNFKRWLEDFPGRRDSKFGRRRSLSADAFLHQAIPFRMNSLGNIEEWKGKRPPVVRQGFTGLDSILASAERDLSHVVHAQPGSTVDTDTTTDWSDVEQTARTKLRHQIQKKKFFASKAHQAWRTCGRRPPDREFKEVKVIGPPTYIESLNSLRQHHTHHPHHHHHVDETLSKYHAALVQHPSGYQDYVEMIDPANTYYPSPMSYIGAPRPKPTMLECSADGAPPTAGRSSVQLASVRTRRKSGLFDQASLDERKASKESLKSWKDKDDLKQKPDTPKPTKKHARAEAKKEEYFRFLGSRRRESMYPGNKKNRPLPLIFRRSVAVEQVKHDSPIAKANDWLNEAYFENNPATMIKAKYGTDREWHVYEGKRLDYSKAERRYCRAKLREAYLRQKVKELEEAAEDSIGSPLGTPEIYVSSEVNLEEQRSWDSVHDSESDASESENDQDLFPKKLMDTSTEEDEDDSGMEFVNVVTDTGIELAFPREPNDSMENRSTSRRKPRSTQPKTPRIRIPSSEFFPHSGSIDDT